MNETTATETKLPDESEIAEIKTLMGTDNLPAEVLIELAGAIRATKLEKEARVRKIRRPRRLGRKYLAENGDLVRPKHWHCDSGILDQLWAQRNMEEFADGN
jgi:hypothetical protein